VLTTLVGSAGATVLRTLTLRELSQRSTEIVAAKAVSSRAEWADFDGASRIVTRTQLQVESVVAGSRQVGQRLELVTLGGTVGDVAQVVYGEARFPVGQHALLFLSPLGSSYRLMGRAQGHYPIALTAEAAGALGPTATLAPSRQLPELMGEGVPAAAELRGLTLQRATALIQQLRSAR